MDSMFRVGAHFLARSLTVLRVLAGIKWHRRLQLIVNVDGAERASMFMIGPTAWIAASWTVYLLI
jgi:hypothetical protein